MSCSNKSANPKPIKLPPNVQKSAYKIKQISQTINLDGLDQEDAWHQVSSIDSFIYPWLPQPPPATSFKAYHDGSFLYFFFSAVDDEMILKDSGDEEMDAVSSDRVEIFIRPDDETKPYYSFEMDPRGKMFDSKGEFGKYIDKEYDYPDSSLVFKGVINDNGYTLEGKLEIKTLNDMGLISPDESIMAGLFRGEYYTDENGEEKTNWISWVIPDSKTPNFHIPSSFGKLILDQN